MNYIINGKYLLSNFKKQLYHPYLRYLGFVFASLALECVVPQIGNSYQSTEIADVNSIKRIH